jgi:hypothetical protein
MLRKPAFWLVFAAVSLACAVLAYRYFPRAFAIVSLEITMDRDGALTAARELATREGTGPADYRDAASFTLDSDAQTFVELEGGGKPAFTRMLREDLYAAYTWRVRHFREGEANETEFRFRPDGRPYGFRERLKEDAPGAALDAGAALRVAEDGAVGRWNMSRSAFTLVEQGQERRPGGRVDHTFTYERPAPTLHEGRYRLRLVVAGDRLTEVTHFVKVPEAFTRRYENMRSANEAIGVGAAVAMTLLYIVGGIGVGLFFMLRRRWVVWRPAAAWGAVIGLLQGLMILNSWPLAWMTYDTAVPRTTYVAQQIALAGAAAVGMSAFLALSFMAAESLTRRAFGAHPQLWRAWGRPASSTEMLGRTVAGFLLVPMFIAYEVGLYFFADRVLGWWTPSEALLHPDVLATYVPWLTAIANSAQAGFWEEALFRAVPIAGAALIGERLGYRRTFIVGAFVVQAIVFGAGHAPYPTLPSFARPVELIIPSIGFGLLYLYFGLIPAVVLHYAFDAVLFALPIFVSDAPGIAVQQVSAAIFILVPLLVVFARRWQAGAWTALDDADRNAAWTPTAPEPVVVEPERPRVQALPAFAKRGWLAAGALGIVVCAAAIVFGDRPGTLPVTRDDAMTIARGALSERSVTLTDAWRLLPTPESGAGAPHQFVAETAGGERRRELLGTYLPRPFWRVRVATFEGDVAERAEEWLVTVRHTREVGRVAHTLPEQRPGASLDEAAARALARQAVASQLRLDAARGEVTEVSAKPSKRSQRTDWTFVFSDAAAKPLPQGDLRIEVEIAGDEVAAVRRFVHVPEDWTRRQRATQTLGVVIGIFGSVFFGGIALAAAVTAVVSWSRRQYSPWLFVAGGALMLAISTASAANDWPALLASLSTAQPLKLQIVAVVAIGFVGLTIAAVLVGLVFGALPHRLAAGARLPDADAARLGAAAGAAGAAVLAIVGSLKTPDWARAADVGALSAYVPILQLAIDPLSGLLMRIAIVVTIVATVDRLTAGWTRRRTPGAIVFVLFGVLAAGPPQGSSIALWAASGLLISAALLAAYVTLLRADLTMLPLALAVMAAMAGALGGAERPFPGALAGSLVGAALTLALGWWWFRLLRRARERVVTAQQAAPFVTTPV